MFTSHRMPPNLALVPTLAADFDHPRMKPAIARSSDGHDTSTTRFTRPSPPSHARPKRSHYGTPLHRGRATSTAPQHRAAPSLSPEVVVGSLLEATSDGDALAQEVAAAMMGTPSEPAARLLAEQYTTILQLRAAVRQLSEELDLALDCALEARAETDRYRAQLGEVRVSAAHFSRESRRSPVEPPPDAEVMARQLRQLRAKLSTSRTLLAHEQARSGAMLRRRKPPTLRKASLSSLRTLSPRAGERPLSERPSLHHAPRPPEDIDEVEDAKAYTTDDLAGVPPIIPDKDPKSLVSDIGGGDAGREQCLQGGEPAAAEVGSSGEALATQRILIAEIQQDERLFEALRPVAAKAVVGDVRVNIEVATSPRVNIEFGQADS